MSIIHLNHQHLKEHYLKCKDFKTFKKHTSKQHNTAPNFADCYTEAKFEYFSTLEAAADKTISISRSS